MFAGKAGAFLSEAPLRYAPYGRKKFYNIGPRFIDVSKNNVFASIDIIPYQF
jgi:hypothetical protein